MADVSITVTDDGPYLVSGPVALTDADGTEHPVGRRVVALCRCGRSASKPFCDGTHARARGRARMPARTVADPGI